MKKTTSCTTPRITNAYNPYGASCIIKTKLLQIVTIFGCISGEGDTMPPHIPKQSLRLNSNGCGKLLETGRIPAEEGGCWKAMHVAAGSRFLPYLRKVSEVVVREFLRLHQLQFLT